MKLNLFLTLFPTFGFMQLIDLVSEVFISLQAIRIRNIKDANLFPLTIFPTGALFGKSSNHF